MQLLKFSTCLFVLLTWAACNGDDDSSPSCIQADWVGTYTGTVQCDTEDAEIVNVTISESGSNTVNIDYATFSANSFFPSLPIEECGIDFSQTDQGLTLTVSATLDGNNLTFTETISSASNSSTCSIIASKI